MADVFDQVALSQPRLKNQLPPSMAGGGSDIFDQVAREGPYKGAPDSLSGTPQSLLDRIGSYEFAPGHSLGTLARNVRAGVGPMLKSTAEVSTPNIAAQMYKRATGQPNNLAEIPGKAAQFFAGTLAGPEAESTWAERGAATEAAPVAEAAGSRLPVASRLARHLPLVGRVLRAKDLVSDVGELLAGKSEAPAPPAAPPTPAWWGKTIGKDVGPLEQWGQTIPQPQSVGAAVPEDLIPTRATNVRYPGEIPPEMIRPRAFAARPAQPIPPRSGLALPPGPADAPAPPSLIDQIRRTPGQIPAEAIYPRAYAARPAEPIPARPGLELPPGPSAPPPASAAGSLVESVRGMSPEQSLRNQIDVLTGNPPPPPVKYGVPLREQMMTSRPAVEAPEGFTPAESSALRSYRYDPVSHEMSIQDNRGTVHVYGDVSPEAADAFAQAGSKGTAWGAIKNNPHVAKLMGGRRIAMKPPATGATPEGDLTSLLNKSVEWAKKRGQ